MEPVLPRIFHNSVYTALLSGWASVMIFPWDPSKTEDPECRYGIKGCHMPLKLCACREKGMIQLLHGFAARLRSVLSVALWDYY